MIRLNDITDKVQSYLPDADIEVISTAYVFSAKVHQGQTRLSGEPYLTHPLEVAYILGELTMDVSSVATGSRIDFAPAVMTSVPPLRSNCTILPRFVRIFGSGQKNLGYFRK